MTMALLDGDIFIYRVGFTTQEQPLGIALARLDESVGAVLNFLGTTDYKVYLTPTDKSNFRYELYPAYKANRTAPKPLYYDHLRNHLLNYHGALLAWGEEADDALGIEATRIGSEAVIVSIDKDLRQVPANHFNFVRGVLDEVKEPYASQSFYRSILTGDRTDNIRGIDGIGPVKAGKIIDHLDSPEKMHNACYKAYTEHGLSVDELHLAAKLLWVRRKENEIWSPPI